MQSKTKCRAFADGVLSGAVEPVGALLTILAAGLIVPAMPYLRSFAAGAMMYAVVEELIPEISAENNLNPNMVRNWKREFLDNAESVFAHPSKSEKEAKRKEAALEKQNTQMLKTIGQLTLERDFLQDCFRKTGRPIPKLGEEES